MRRINYSRELRNIHHTQIRNGERTAFEISRCKFTSLSLGDKSFRLTSNRPQTFAIRIAQHWHNQARWDIDRHANIDMLMEHKLSFSIRAIDLRELLKSQRTSLDDQVINTDLH